jgi:type 1 fimbria pilin
VKTKDIYLKSMEILISLCLLAVSNIVAAGCTAISATDATSYYKFSLPAPNIPAFNPSSYATGAVIYSYSIPSVANYGLNIPYYGGSLGCTDAWNSYFGGNGTPSNNIYPTSAAGVGLRITVAKGALPSLDSHTAGQNVGLTTFFKGMTIEFIKTGDITAVSSITGTIASIRVETNSGQELLRIYWATPVVIRPTVPTCSVATSMLNVSMGMVSSNMFSGVGSTSRGGIPFQLQLACSGGSTGTYTNAYITLTDNYNQGNVSNMLSTQSGNGAASGVGIQILKDGGVLNFGPDSNATGNTNQWFAGAVYQGRTSFSIPLTARYVQTQSLIIPGSINARATFTMSYQ